MNEWAHIISVHFVFEILSICFVKHFRTIDKCEIYQSMTVRFIFVQWWFFFFFFRFRRAEKNFEKIEIFASHDNWEWNERRKKLIRNSDNCKLNLIDTFFKIKQKIFFIAIAIIFVIIVFAFIQWLTKHLLCFWLKINLLSSRNNLTVFEYCWPCLYIFINEITRNENRNYTNFCIWKHLKKNSIMIKKSVVAYNLKTNWCLFDFNFENYVKFYSSTKKNHLIFINIETFKLSN